MEYVRGRPRLPATSAHARFLDEQKLREGFARMRETRGELDLDWFDEGLADGSCKMASASQIVRKSGKDVGEVNKEARRQRETYTWPRRALKHANRAASKLGKAATSGFRKLECCFWEWLHVKTFYVTNLI